MKTTWGKNVRRFTQKRKTTLPKDDLKETNICLSNMVRYSLLCLKYILAIIRKWGGTSYSATLARLNRLLPWVEIMAVACSMYNIATTPGTSFPVRLSFLLLRLRFPTCPRLVLPIFPVLGYGIGSLCLVPCRSSSMVDSLPKLHGFPMRFMPCTPMSFFWPPLVFLGWQFVIPWFSRPVVPGGLWSSPWWEEQGLLLAPVCESRHLALNPLSWSYSKTPLPRSYPGAQPLAPHPSLWASLALPGRVPLCRLLLLLSLERCKASLWCTRWPDLEGPT